MIFINMNIEKLVKQTFYDLLLEQPTAPEKPDPTQEKPEQEKKPKRKKKKAEPGSINIAQGSLGRGRFSAFVSEAGARSESNPKDLMKDLGVKSPTGGDDIDKVRSILQPALTFHPLMRQAFGGASSSRVKMGEDEAPISGVRVTVAEISTRNGIKFISHTLAGAKNAGMLSLDGAIEIGLHDGEIFLKSI
jgi:hypothetical protein